MIGKHGAMSSEYLEILNSTMSRLKDHIVLVGIDTSVIVIL